MTGRKNRPGAGRPPRYKTPEEMKALIDRYFTECEGELLRDEDTGKVVTDKRGNAVYVGRRPPTVTGMALALGFTTRQSLLNYEAKNRGFRQVLQIAKSRIEQYAEERLYDRDGCMGARFNLQNNFRGWNGDRRDGGADIEDLTPLAELLRE